MAQQVDTFDNMFNLGGKTLSQGTFSSTPAFVHNNNIDLSSFDPSQQTYPSAHHLSNISGHYQQQQPSFSGHAGFLADSPSNSHPQTQIMNNADMNAATSLLGFTNKTAPLTHSFAQTNNGAQLAGSWGNLIVAQNSNTPVDPSNGGYAAVSDAGDRAASFVTDSQTWSGNGNGDHDRSQASRSQHARSTASHYLVQVDPFHASEPQSTPSRRVQQRRFPGVDFGSDTSFSSTHYQAPQYEKDKSGNLLNVPLADKVRVPYGPHAMANHETIQQAGGSWGGLAGPGFNRPLDEEELASSSQARKRHKGQPDPDAEHVWDPRVGHQSGHGLQSIKLEQIEDEPSMSAPTASSSIIPPPPAKRRRPADRQTSQISTSPAAIQDDESGETSVRKRGAKKRENLTEDQKRKNHIHSEKKRREIIQQGYADLNKLVPCLSSGKSGLSRSECLMEISSYLETLITGNDMMMEKIGPQVDDNHPALLAANADWAAATARIE